MSGGSIPRRCEEDGEGEQAGGRDQAGVDALNAVSPALTTERLTELNRRVTEERAVPTDLAKEFVGSLGP